jgi:hypothetical protein
MSITKAPKKPQTDATADFINRAPDAAAISAASQPVEVSQNKKPITITFDPVLLAQLDAAARRMGISRSSALAVAVSRWLGIE